MRAEKVGSDTMLARIVAMVAEAQRSRAPIQRMADTVAGYFVPAVIAVAVLAFVAWAVWGPAPALSYALIAAVSVRHHRLPLRARPGDAHEHHGRRRQGAPARACSSQSPRRWSAWRRSTRWSSTRPAR